jgi:hypothetical protein
MAGRSSARAFKATCARWGALFNTSCELLLHDITSTYFEGNMERCPLAQRGYSRDSRGDRPRVCVGLAVTEDGLPWATRCSPAAPKTPKPNVVE